MGNHRSSTAIAVLGAGVALFPLDAAAQEAGAGETFQLPDIVLPGIEQSAQRAAELKRAAPNAIEVIDDEQIEQFNEQRLGEALRRLPGVTFDGANRSREVRLRGLPGEYTQVLINGRPLVDGESRRSFEVDRIPAGLVERVEIVRSPRASQDGAGPAGTVNVVLKSGVDVPAESEISVGGGYLEDQGALGGLTFSHAGSAGPLAFNFAGSFQQTRRSESKDEFEFDGTGAPDGGELELNERRFEQGNVTPSFTLDMGSGGTLTLNPFYFFTKEFRDDIETDLEDDQVTIDRVSNEEREREREAYGISAAWDVDLGSQSSLGLSFDWQEGRTDTERDEIRLEADGTLNRTRQRTEGIDLQRIRPEAVLSMQAGAHDLSFGVGANLQEHNETNFARQTDSSGTVETTVREARLFDIDEDIIFGYAEDVWEPTDRLTLTGGIRVEASSTDTTDFFGATNSNDETFVLPSVNIVYNLSSQTDLRAGGARTLRRPDLRELTPAFEEEDGTVVDPDERGNPNQDPESIWGFDVGVDHFFAGNRGNVSVNLFGRTFEDKIETVIGQEVVPGLGTRFVASPDNVGDGEAYGIEFSGRAPLDSLGLVGVTIWGSGVYTESEVDLDDGTTRQFLDQPEFVGTLGLDYDFRPWKTTFGVAVNWTSEVDQTQSLSGGGSLDQSIESRVRLDLSSRTEIADNTFLSISATNLLAQTEDRVDRVFDASGVLDSTTRTSEPTNRTLFARVTKRF